jgi:hypothetical protein
MPPFLPNAPDATVGFQAMPDSQDFEILLRGIVGSGVVTGCAVTAQGVPNMTVAVAIGTVMLGAAPVRTAVTAGNVTIAANATSFYRIDLIEVNSAGTKVAVQGTPGSATQMPTIPAPSAGSVPLAAVFVQPGAVSITSGYIIDKRVFTPPGAWQAYTPTFTGVTQGAGPTNLGRYRVVDGTTVHFETYFIFGTGGAASASITIGLPIAHAATGMPTLVGARALDTSANARYVCNGVIGSGASIISSLISPSSLTAVWGVGAPFVWAVGDSFQTFGTYEVA